MHKIIPSSVQVNTVHANGLDSVICRHKANPPPALWTPHKSVFDPLQPIELCGYWSGSELPWGHKGLLRDGNAGTICESHHFPTVRSSPLYEINFETGITRLFSLVGHGKS